MDNIYIVIPLNGSPSRIADRISKLVEQFPSQLLRKVVMNVWVIVVASRNGLMIPSKY